MYYANGQPIRTPLTDRAAKAQAKVSFVAGEMYNRYLYQSKLEECLFAYNAGMEIMTTAGANVENLVEARRCFAFYSEVMQMLATLRQNAPEDC